MAVRQIYSCDWCGLDAPKPGSVGEDWELVYEPGQNDKVTLCGTCLKTVRHAWAMARAERVSVRK